MKVLIIGGGIGGLTTALACQHFAIDYEVFEAAPEIREVGAGIWVPPNAMQVMNRLGQADKIMNTGFLLDSISVGGPTDGNWYTLQTRNVIKKFQFGTVAIHRGRFQSLLYEQLDRTKVHPGKRLTSLVEKNGKMVVYFNDGSEIEGDVVIGADGVRSQTRTLLFGEKPLRYSGQTCWRGIVKHQLPEKQRNAMRELWGKQPGQRFAYSHISNQEVYYYGTLATHAGEKDNLDELKRTLEKNFGGFGATAKSIIDQIDPATVIRTDLFDLAPLDNWVKGSVALLGDAAHATTPNLGQGAAQAIEDAYVLIQQLKQQADIQTALMQYQSRRMKKALHIVNTSWKLGQITNLRSPVGIRLRNFVIRTTPAFITNKQIDRIYRINF